MVPQPPTTLFCSGAATTVTVPQLSVAVTVGAVGIAMQSTDTSAGALVNTGAVLSSTVMVCVRVVELPHWSVAVQDLTMVPQPPTTLFCSGAATTVTVPQLSVAVTVGAVGIALQSTDTLAGALVNTGAVLSVNGDGLCMSC